MIFLDSNVIIFLFSEAIIALLLLVALYNSIVILRGWDFSKTTQKQYRLESRAYLVVLIISFALVFKIFNFFYFTYTVDALAVLIPGAMCGAGVLDANGYGMVTMSLKLAILFFIGIWLLINKADIEATDYPYLRRKLLLFILIFALIAVDGVIELRYFSDISTKKVLRCCSSIYGGDEGGGIPFDLSLTQLAILFYLFYLLALFSALFRYRYFSFAAHTLFLIVAYYGVVYLFGIYIYELPTHHCPFCMLQSHYYYIGYAVWITLFLGVFFGIVNAFLYLFIGKENGKFYRYAALFLTIFILICSYFVLSYYIKNGVFL